MKYVSSFAALVLSTVIASEGINEGIKLSLFGGSQKVLGAGAEVPGINPLNYCKSDHSDDILVLDHVNLDPNPPKSGQTLSIEAVGELLEDVEQDAYVVLQVKYGLIRLINTQADLCEQVSNVDLQCPIKKGLVTITKDIELPREIPPGKYTVFADAYNSNGKKILCLESTVTFSMQ